MSNIFIGLKKDLFGCFKIEKNVTKTMKTGLKKGGGIEIENLQVLSIYAMHALSLFAFDFDLLTVNR